MSLIKQCCWIAAIYSLILLLTRSFELGDTGNYAAMISGHLGQSPFGTTDSLWEFGHLVWRPLGWLLLTLAAPVFSAMTDWTPFMQAAFVLIAVSWVASIVTVVLWYSLLIEIGASQMSAALVAIALGCANGFLLYAHSGCSYVAGLAFVSASAFLLRGGKVPVAAICFAAAVLLWLPYVLSGLGLFALACAPRDLNQKGMQSGRAIRFALIAIALIVAGYGLGGVARGIKNTSEAKAWYADSNHGWAQTQRALRLATGLPRSTFYLGRDGMVIKRYLRHDPYAPVSLFDLVRASLWKLAVFYLFLAIVLLELWRASQPRWPLLIFLAGGLPILFFAVFVFEPSSPERFLPAFPFVLLAAGWILRDGLKRPLHASVTAFLALVVVSDLWAFAAPRVGAQNSAALARVTQLRARFTPASRIVLVSNQDTLEEYLSRSIFDPVTRPTPFRIYEVVEPASVRMLTWRRDFAAEVFDIWSNGGEIWLSRRLCAAKPKPEWNWVEKDDPRQVWSEVYTFFQPLETDVALDGSDGFARLAHTEANSRNLKMLLDAPAGSEIRQ